MNILNARHNSERTIFSLLEGAVPVPLIRLDRLRRRFQFGRTIKDIIMGEPERKRRGIELTYKLHYDDPSQLKWTTLAINSVVGCEDAKNSVRSRCQFGRQYRWS